jgi:hypothetical protein
MAAIDEMELDICGVLTQFLQHFVGLREGLNTQDVIRRS